MFCVSLITVLICLLNEPLLIQTNPSNEECEELLRDAENSWTDHSEQPKCTENDPIIDRISGILVDASLCPEYVITEIKILNAVFQDLHNAVCDDKDLHRDFAAKAPCWYVARNCVFKTAKSIHSDDEVTPEICRQLDEEFETCRDVWCEELQVTLLDYFKNRSPCSTMEYNSSIRKDSNFIASIWSILLLVL